MLVLFFGKCVGIIFVFSAFWTLLVYGRLPPINLNFLRFRLIGRATATDTIKSRNTANYKNAPT